MGPLEGIRIVEWATWVAVPGSAAILSDWGAQVIKVEHPQGGDPLRGFLSLAGGVMAAAPFNYTFELDNRNKRSVVLDLNRERGREVMYKLLAGADVLLTNVLPSSREQLKLDYAAVSRMNPRLVYVALSGYGQLGPERDRAGYDFAAFWARSGIMSILGEPDALPVPQRAGMGDHATSMLLAGAVAAALFHREKSGQGQEVYISLFNTGTWVAGMNVQEALATGGDIPRLSRHNAGNPLFNTYRTQDGWVQFVMLQSDRYWAGLCRALGREDLIQDPRFNSHQARSQNNTALIAILEEVLATRTTQEWAKGLDANELIWAPVQSIAQALRDPQAEVNTHFARLDHPAAGEIRLVASPVKFGKTPATVRASAPEFGQHTEEVLLEIGYSWEDIAQLKEEGAIG